MYICFPKEGVTAFFNGYPSTLRQGEKPKWYFDIREDNGNYHLKVHSAGAKEQKIDNYLNKWDQIDDLRNRYEKPSNRGKEDSDNNTF